MLSKLSYHLFIHSFFVYCLHPLRKYNIHENKTDMFFIIISPTLRTQISYYIVEVHYRLVKWVNTIIFLCQFLSSSILKRIFRDKLYCSNYIQLWREFIQCHYLLAHLCWGCSVFLPSISSISVYNVIYQMKWSFVNSLPIPPIFFLCSHYLLAHKII